MRVVLDTNILLSGLMSLEGAPGRLLDAWQDNKYTLISSEEQLREFRRASRYVHVAKYVTYSEAGALVNAVRSLAVMVDHLPVVKAISVNKRTRLLVFSLPCRVAPAIA